jgi:hypothetical protein
VEPGGGKPGDGSGVSHWTTAPCAGAHVHYQTSGTIEERIDALLAEKRHFADDILRSDGEVNLTELPDEELLHLVRLDVTRARV